MAISFILMDSTLQDLSNDTKNTKFGVRTKKLCKFQSMKIFIVAEGISARCSRLQRLEKAFLACQQ